MATAVCIVVNALFVVLGIYIFYFIIKLAVKNALLEYDCQKQEL
ncbi:hypothetical protein [Syntrophaceticus schinkii]|jgi:hypothetical protein|nr:hypothetical protein [Syntrophaceticus schinkii]MDD4674154.1 hypothetical protein [Syntrophaceticus schinkii]